MRKEKTNNREKKTESLRSVSVESEQRKEDEDISDREGSQLNRADQEPEISN